MVTKDADRRDRTLSAHALAALAAFNADKDEHAKKFDKLKAEAEADGPLSMEAFTEDWNESQFWVGVAKKAAALVIHKAKDGLTKDVFLVLSDSMQMIPPRFSRASFLRVPPRRKRSVSCLPRVRSWH